MNLPLEPPICSVGLVVASSTLLVGETAVGGVAFKVEPSGAAPVDPAAADVAESGATGVPPLHAMVATIATTGRALASCLNVLSINVSQFGPQLGRWCAAILPCIFMAPKTLSAKNARAANIPPRA